VLPQPLDRDALEFRLEGFPDFLAAHENPRVISAVQVTVKVRGVGLVQTVFSDFLLVLLKNRRK
jgi:hypothetical protein